MAVIPSDRHNLALTFIISLLYQSFFFCIASWYKFDKVTDLAGGTNFVVLTIVTWATGGSLQGRSVAVNCLVIAWGMRLSGYLFYRILKIDKDDRFDKLRDDNIRFAFFWIFQLLWVWTVSFPVSLMNSCSEKRPLNTVDFVGLAVSSAGLIMETVADQSKFQFRLDSNNSNRWCDVGIWRFSRHPNYCGELMFWWGIFTSCAQIFTSDEQYYSIISPIFITSIIFGLSGLPVLEYGANRRFGENSEYLKYRNMTSILVPMPNFLYGMLPAFVKAILLFDLPCYQSGISDNVLIDSMQ